MPSVEYSYSWDEELQQEWEWTEMMAGQPEIEKYANHVADRFGLRSDIQFNTRVTSMAFQEGTRMWRVATAHNPDTEYPTYWEDYPPSAVIGTFSGASSQSLGIGLVASAAGWCPRC